MLVASASGIEFFHEPSVYDNFDLNVYVRKESYVAGKLGYVDYIAILNCKNKTPDPSTDLFVGQVVEVQAVFNGIPLLHDKFVFEPGCAHNFSGKLLLDTEQPNLTINFGVRTDVQRAYANRPTTYYPSVSLDVNATQYLNRPQDLWRTPSTETLIVLALTLLLAFIGLLLVFKYFNPKGILFLIAAVMLLLLAFYLHVTPF